MVKNESEYRILRILAYFILGSFTLLTIVPLVWLFYSSFKTNAEIVQNIFALPSKLYINNFVRVWELAHMDRLIINSLIYAGVSTFITVYLASATGYAFAKFDFKISGFFYTVLLAGLLITVHAILVPLFLMENALHISNTRLGIILPYVAFGLPFMIYLSTSYMKGIPNALIEAAAIDGANHITILHKVVLPISRPIITTMTIFSFLANWNEFVLVLVLTSGDKLRSIPLGINFFAGGLARNFGLLFAALVIATVPMLIFYLIFYKKIIDGFAAGALKE